MAIALVGILGTDLKLVFRRLGKSPGFAATVILTLAIGIGANTAVFSVLKSVLFKPLPYPKPNQLVAVRLIASGAQGWRTSPVASASRLPCISPSPSRTGRFNRLACGSGAQQMSPASASHTKSTLPRSPTVCCKRSVCRLSWAVGSCRPPESAWSENRSAQLRLLAAPLRWRPVGHWMQYPDRFAAAEIVGVMPQGFRLVADFDVMAPLAFDRNTKSCWFRFSRHRTAQARNPDCASRC